MHPDKEDSRPPTLACAFEPGVVRKPDRILMPPWLSIGTFDRVIISLDVQLITVSEYVLGPGSALDLGARDTPSFHYIRRGQGILHTPGDMSIAIGPQTLIIVPPKCTFRFGPASAGSTEMQGAGQAATEAFMLYGEFRSLCGNSIELFDTLRVPIVEQFSDEDALELMLQLVLDELAAGDVCSEVLVSTAMKQVIVALIRRSFQSANSWTRRFAVLGLADQEDAYAHLIQDTDKNK